MIWIVSGPSCSGKSTFLEGSSFLELSGLSKQPPIVLASSIGSLKCQLDSAHTFAYHYNTLRPITKYLQANNSLPRIKAEIFQTDPAWRLIRDSAMPKRAIVLTCSKEILLRRANMRTSVNTSGLRQGSKSDYVSKEWTELISSIDIESLNTAWCKQLQQCKIDYQIINNQKLLPSEAVPLVA